MLAFLIAASTPVHAFSMVTVHLVVNGTVTYPFNEPAFLAVCDVEVEAGSDAGDVLDAAAAGGCIADWSSVTHPDFGRFLTGLTKQGLSTSTDARNVDTVRFMCGAPNNVGGSSLYSFWAFGVNGIGSLTGIDGYSASNNDVVSFHYVVDACAFALSLVGAVGGLGPISPVPIAGDAGSDPGTSEL
jgi:hypothetical protein